MFIKTTKYTINAEHILWAERNSDETTSIYLSNGSAIVLADSEAEEIWGMVGRKTLPSVFRKEGSESA